MSGVVPLSDRLANLRAWRLLDVEIERLRADGYTVNEIADKTGRSETLVMIRLWRNSK